MKNAILVFCVAFLLMVCSSNAFGQCSGGIIHTSCPQYQWQNVDGTVDVVLDGVLRTYNDDGPRLQRAIDSNPGKIIFNEAEYFIDTPLDIKSYRILEGTGRSSFIANRLTNPPQSVHLTSKIIQTNKNASIFKVGINVTDVSIRDIALVVAPALVTDSQGNRRTDNLTIGIHAEGNCVAGCSSIGFQFSNLKFSGFDKGIFVNATDPSNPPADPNGHNWQFDNVRLDQAFFENCRVGVHINSFNSGWDISSIDFLIPKGVPQSFGTGLKTYGIYLERSTYTSTNMLIGNGPTSAGPDLATALIYVKDHGNITIQDTIAEGFHQDIYIDGNSISGTGRNFPINLMNNVFLNGIYIKDSTVFSTSNQFGIGNVLVPAIADGTSQIYSIGDKFCIEGQGDCDEGRSYQLVGVDARLIFSSNQAKNSTSVPSFMTRDTYPCPTPPLPCENALERFIPNLSVIAPNYSNAPLFRLGIRGFNYDFTRSEEDGKLIVRGSQNNYSGYSFEMPQDTDYNGITDRINNVKINNNGSITFGSIIYTELDASPVGTMVYCSNCQQTNPCSSGGYGAMAKRIKTGPNPTDVSWICN